eukprot:512918_1
MTPSKVKNVNHESGSLSTTTTTATDNTSILSKIKYSFQNEMDTLLKINPIETNNQNNYKTQDDILTECSDCVVNDKDCDIYDNCASIPRIIAILKGYIQCTICEELYNNSKFTSLSEILSFKNIYSLTQINDDFIHIKDHMDQNRNNAKELVRKFREELKCIDRNYRRLNHSKFENLEDSILQQTLEKIYSYLTNDEIDFDIDEKKDINPNIKIKSKQYIGKKEDDKWWNYDINSDMEQEEINKHIYYHLVTHMNIFRWQCPHGFTSKQHHALMHLRPKYKNVKEEALNNSYYCLSKDNWNQTLRKSTVFFKSFAKQRIKTIYNGKYDDKITCKITKWKKGETIDMPEIVTLKLYTDFDKLQYELKKCFRFDTMSDIFTLN